MSIYIYIKIIGLPKAGVYAMKYQGEVKKLPPK